MEYQATSLDSYVHYNLNDVEFFLPPHHPKNELLFHKAKFVVIF